MHQLHSSAAHAALALSAILVFVGALLLQNWALDMVVGLGSVLAVLVVVTRSGAHA